LLETGEQKEETIPEEFRVDYMDMIKDLEGTGVIRILSWI